MGLRDNVVEFPLFTEYEREFLKSGQHFSRVRQLPGGKARGQESGSLLYHDLCANLNSRTSLIVRELTH